MIGEKLGVITRIKQLAPECASTHCFIHRESFATKRLSTKLDDVLCEVVKIVNYVKGSAVNLRLFALLCDDMQADHRQPLFHFSVRWLSRGKVLSRVYELRNELAVFLHDRKPDWAKLFCDEQWLAYLTDIFVIINGLNTSMQGRNDSLFAAADKIDGMQRKLKAWKIRVSNNCYDIFPQLATVIDDAGDNLDVKCVQDTATEPLSNLVERIQHYFPEQKDPQRGNGWIRNPFAPTVNVEELNISVDLKDKLFELSANKGLRNSFESNSFASF